MEQRHRRHSSIESLNRVFGSWCNGDFATTILLFAPDGIKIRTKDMKAGTVQKARGRQPSALSSRLLSRRRSQPRLRHFLLDCGKRRFSRLFFCFSHSHTSTISEIQGIVLVNIDQVTI
jgi:hypothetical protein